MTLLAWFILLPFLAAPAAYLIGHLPRRSHKVSLSFWMGLLGLAVTSVMYLRVVRGFLAGKDMTYTLGSVSLALDGVGLLMSGVVLALGLVVTIYSAPYLRGEDNQDKYYAMLLSLVGTIIGLSCATDLFNLWVWFEAMAVSSFLLVAFYRDQKNALEAGIKYLIQSAAGSILVLLGTALVLAQTGTVTLSEIRLAAASSPLVLLAAGALLTIGFGVKVALVPLHTWLPDAHSQAPSGISAMLSGIVIEAGLIALLRALSSLTGMAGSWGVMLMGFGALNMLFGNLMALRQKQVKRLLAYSSLSHMGYMLLGLGITFYAGEAMGAQGSFFHLVNHGLMKGLAFLAAGALLYALHVANYTHDPLTVADLDGASRRYPLVAVALSLALLALGGMPPLAGFMSKWQIFLAGFETRNTWIIALVIFAALNSVLSLGYYAPLVNALYKRKTSLAVDLGKPVPFAMTLPLVVLSLAVLVLGFWPSLLDWLTGPAGLALTSVFGG